MMEAAITVGIIVLQSVALLVALLVIIAYLLLADRKIWAAVQMRRGPNVVGPWVTPCYQANQAAKSKAASKSTRP